MATMEDGGSESVTEVILRLTDPTYPFVGVSREEGCVISLQRMLPRGPGEYAEFFSISGIDPDRVVELAEANEHVMESTVVSRDGDHGLFEFIVSTRKGSCPARDLAELGAVPRKITGSDGEGIIVTEFVGEESVTELLSTFFDQHPDAELVAKRQKDYGTPLFGIDDLEQAVSDSLTERQQEVLLTAFEAGYYEWPRTVNGETVAEELGISQPTFCKHLRTAERKVLSLIYECQTNAE